MFNFTTSSPAAAFPSIWWTLLSLVIAAALGAALSVVRPVRRRIVPRPTHVVQAQILLTIVGAMIMIVVADNLARAFAVVGAAGLVRYRARIDDPKDAGVMLVALAVGLAVGVGRFEFAAMATVFCIAVLSVLEAFEPAVRARFDLRIATEHQAIDLQPAIEQALQKKGVTFKLREASRNSLHYDVTVPFEKKTRKLSKLIRRLDGKNPGTSITWELRKPAHL